jgi:hypothetical protein
MKTDVTASESAVTAGSVPSLVRTAGRSTTSRILFVTATLLAATIAWPARGGAPVAERANRVAPLYSVTAEQICIHSENFRVNKKVDSLVFQGITEMGEAPDIQLIYLDQEAGVQSTITFFPAPLGTIGPKVILDEQGKPKPAKDKDNPYAVLELSDPSKAFVAEYKKVLDGLQKTFGFTLANEGGKPKRRMAVPSDIKNSPVGYCATLRGNGEFKHPELKEVPWVWEVQLYLVGATFVKVNTEGPARLETTTAAARMTDAISWIDSAGGTALQVKEPGSMSDE